MTWQQILFSFNGRLNRAKYWLVGLIYLGLSAVLFAFGVWVFAQFNGDETVVVPIFVVLALIYLAALYALLAVGAKRLHDRDKSAVWLIVFYVLPSLLGGFGAGSGEGGGAILGVVGLAISIWGLVELGFLRGTAGSNQYGPDPLA